MRERRAPLPPDMKVVHRELMEELVEASWAQALLTSCFTQIASGLRSQGFILGQATPVSSRRQTVTTRSLVLAADVRVPDEDFQFKLCLAWRLVMSAADGLSSVVDLTAHAPYGSSSADEDDWTYVAARRCGRSPRLADGDITDEELALRPASAPKLVLDWLPRELAVARLADFWQISAFGRMRQDCDYVIHTITDFTSR